MLVFWVHASSAARFEEGYRKIADRIKISGWDNREVNILQLVNNWLCDEANGRWFMIIDNADDASVFSHPADESKFGDNSNTAASAEVLSEFLPQSQNGSILVTSRSRDVAFRITGDTRDIITVDPMDERVAMDLLHKKLHGDFNKMMQRGSCTLLTTCPLLLPKLHHSLTREVHTQRSPNICKISRKAILIGQDC